MAGQERFYICTICGNLVGTINFSGVPMVCCGTPMEKLIANTVDASAEKHVPVFNVNNNIVEVKVGSEPHPMIKEHYIEWIYLETKHGGQRKALSPEDNPEATFSLINDELIAVYAYCNLHGLWRSAV